MNKTKQIISFILCMVIILALSVSAYAGTDPVCTPCVADSYTFGLSRTGRISAAETCVNVRYHHEVTDNSNDLLACANPDDLGVVSRVHYSDYAWYYIDITYGHAIGHNGWVRGDFVDLWELR